MKKKFFIIDTSAILSGKPLSFPEVTIVTTPGISDEFHPGGRDFRRFELLKETGLMIQMPTKDAITKVKQTAQKTGDDRRLSVADIEIIALALDINKEETQEATILSDDYSIQNIASTLGIDYQGFAQKEITKKFKWVSRCPGCGKQFTKVEKICTICGTETRPHLSKKKKL